MFSTLVQSYVNSPASWHNAVKGIRTILAFLENSALAHEFNGILLIGRDGQEVAKEAGGLSKIPQFKNWEINPKMVQDSMTSLSHPRCLHTMKRKVCSPAHHTPHSKEKHNNWLLKEAHFILESAQTTQLSGAIAGFQL